MTAFRYVMKPNRQFSGNAINALTVTEIPVVLLVSPVFKSAQAYRRHTRTSEGLFQQHVSCILRLAKTNADCVIHAYM